MKTVIKFLRNQQGTETVEWAIVLGIIAVGAITAAVAIGGYVSAAFQNTQAAFADSGSPIYTPPG
jgi:Flp pilus assembly pilin Flp